jgi:hypothetical protein
MWMMLIFAELRLEVKFMFVPHLFQERRGELVFLSDVSFSLHAMVGKNVPDN